MSGQTQHAPVKTSNLPNKCPMTGTNLEACHKVRTKIGLDILLYDKTNLH